MLAYDIVITSSFTTNKIKIKIKKAIFNTHYDELSKLYKYAKIISLYSIFMFISRYHP